MANSIDVEKISLEWTVKKLREMQGGPLSGDDVPGQRLALERAIGVCEEKLTEEQHHRRFMP